LGREALAFCGGSSRCGKLEAASVSRLEGERMTDQRRRLDDIERTLSEKQQQLSAANRELEQRSQDVDTLIRWIERLEEQSSKDTQMLASLIESLLNSRRWKVGSAISELARRALLKPAVAGADDPSRIGNTLRTWQREFRARRDELRVRREEFRTRREYLNQAKSRPGAIETRETQTLDRPPIDTAIGATSAAPPVAPGLGHFNPADHILNDLRDRRPVTILVPIRNAYEDLKSCLESVVRNTTAPAELLLIDDASIEPSISSLLAEYEALEYCRVLKHDENQGFARTVNRGLSESSGDVVLLDSGTEVAPRWLENLTLAACADPRIATVTAISDNAGVFSVPDINEANSTPEALDRDDTGRLITQQSAQVYPQTPTGSSFCVYIKRAALDEIGALDVEYFPRGYEAVRDFCMRAQKRGWHHVVDDTTFAFHKYSASYENGKRELVEAGREMLDELHPEYGKLVRAFVFSEDMERVGGNVRTAYNVAESGQIRVRPRVLFVLHQAGGGTPYTSRDLMGALADRYSSYVLVSDALWLRLFRYETGSLVLVEKFSLRRKWRITEFSRPDYRGIVFSLLVKYRFELVHIRHLLGHTFDLPEIAARLRIPVILSFHDFYISCPTMHLIDDHGKYCGGICTPGLGQCRLPKALARDVPAPLKHNWLKTWRQNVERMFEHVDAFVTTSYAAKEVYVHSLPVLRGGTFEVIEHGRDLEQEHRAVPPGEGPIRILIPGNLEVHKGAKFLRDLKQMDAEERLELHFLGNVADDYRDLGVVHGPYKREEFNGRVGEIGPSFIGIFSIWPETYCHTLTEAWAAGVPVLISDIGALKERVEAHGGGWLLDHEDPQGSYERILKIAGDSETYISELERADLHGIRSTAEMSDDYDALYESVLQEHRSFNKTAS
jgi:GT2 family glycosyltransferase/glycosyltransferase involved in cell wall biosynthesis